MATKIKICEKVLEKLNVIAKGEAGAGEDFVITQAKYDEVYSLLSQKDLAQWPNNDVPNWGVALVVPILANLLTDHFVTPTETAMKVGSEAASAWRELAVLSVPKYESEGEVTKITNY